MYGLKDDLDLSFFKGLVFEQIAIGLYQVQFGFDQNTRLSVELRFNYTSAGKTVEWEPLASKSAAAVLNLLGASITAVVKPDSKTLRLEFSNGDLLQVFDASEEYESFSITRPGLNVIVWPYLFCASSVCSTPPAWGFLSSVLK